METIKWYVVQSRLWQAVKKSKDFSKKDHDQIYALKEDNTKYSTREGLEQWGMTIR